MSAVSVRVLAGVFMLFSIAGKAQPVALWLDTTDGCTGDTILLHLKTSDFYQVGSLTLYIAYNANELQYDTAYNLHPMLPGLLVNLITTGQPTVGFSWFTGNLNPVNIGQGALATLRFIKLADTAYVQFMPQCEITNPQGQPLQATYTHSTVTLRRFSIYQQPASKTVAPGNPAVFTVGVADTGVDYRWQSSVDGVAWMDLDDDMDHGGTHTDELSLFQPDLSLHEVQFRCRLTKGNCTGFSDPAVLHIDTTQSIIETVASNRSTYPYPNPFFGTIIVPWFGHRVKTCTFVLRDMQGRMVDVPQGSHIRPTDAGVEISGLRTEPGTYLIHLYINDIYDQQYHQAYLIMSK